MFICGKDGEELRCCKTGLTIKDVRYVDGTRHSADMYYCPVCGNLLINRSASCYSVSDLLCQADVTMGNDHLVWNPDFREKIEAQYGITLLNT